MLSKITKNSLNKNTFRLTPIIIIVSISVFYLILSFDRFEWFSDKETTNFNIISDGSGYYAYLPAVFIYRDLKFSFLKKIKNKYQTLNLINGTNPYAKPNEIKNKYWIGTAILQSPFFLINHFYKSAFSHNNDGYSNSYRFTISFTAIIYFIIAFYFFYNFFILLGIKKRIILLVFIAISLGSSLQHYVVYLPSYSHIYSFALINASFYFFLKSKMQYSKSSFFMFWISITLVILIRPTNGIVLFSFPFFFRNKIEFKHYLKLYLLKINRNNILLLAIIFFLFSLQILNIYLQTGNYKLNSYSNESFSSWTNPKMLEVLFSFKKGLFIYAPIFFLIIPGILILFLKNKSLFFLFILNFILITYLISSWWCWWYGGGLGMRTYIDFYILLAIPIVFLFQESSTFLKSIFIGFLLFAIFLYQIYQIQFNKDILHYEKMNSSNFWTPFLRTSSRFCWFVYFQDSSVPKNLKLENTKKIYYNNFRKIWFQTPQQTNFDFGKKNEDLKIFKSILLKDYDSGIGLKVSSEHIIYNPDTNPGFVYLLYKEGLVKRKKNIFIGSRIKFCNKAQKITHFVFFKNLFKQNKYDSLVVYFTKNIPPSGIKNLQIELLKYKKVY
ncbi:MAG: hypothetical protein HYU67_01555 [Flavobacteriia bacterium]|nr:hypothetical protein [Flavobacteriia bacterium]